MRVETTFVREAGERALPAALAVPVTRTRGRPKQEYTYNVCSPEDVETLRERKVPVFLLTPEWVSARGYPVSFEPRLAVPRMLAQNFKSVYHVMKVRDPDTVANPGLEEMVTLLLRFDRLAARVVAKRNEGELNREELYRRVRNERLERSATKVRLFEFVPALPREGDALRASDLEWVEMNNPPRTLAR